jgi:hypothetical protein
LVVDPYITTTDSILLKANGNVLHGINHPWRNE